jgi:hypothetical protein
MSLHQWKWIAILFLFFGLFATISIVAALLNNGLWP